MDRSKVLTAVIIFFVSLGITVVVGLGLGAFLPSDACTFPVAFDRTATEEVVEATVTQVDGNYLVATIGYKAVVLDTPEGRIIQEGNLTDLSPDTPGLSFHPMDESTDLLQAGDHFHMTLGGEAHLILVDDGGTPIGWTLGCEA